jgi:hypothetical protein
VSIWAIPLEDTGDLVRAKLNEYGKSSELYRALKRSFLEEFRRGVFRSVNINRKRKIMLA